LDPSVVRIQSGADKVGGIIEEGGLSGIGFIHEFSPVFGFRSASFFRVLSRFLCTYYITKRLKLQCFQRF
jgi:hypothetical protein